MDPNGSRATVHSSESTVDGSKVEPLSFAHENDEFYDALCSPCSDVSLKSCNSNMGKNSVSRTQSLDSFSDGNRHNIGNCSKFHSGISLDNVQPHASIYNRNDREGKRRTTVPAKADHGFSLWSLIKHCIGKDLTKIPLPVYFNEPLSTLQRLTEEYEYADLVDHAIRLEDPWEQLAYLAAFVISSYSSSSKRTGKPFNPLLGETFECDRMDDLGWRCISEQVSHHPPVLAQHCEGRGWVAWQEFSMTTKLKGTSLQVNPVGVNHLKFLDSGYHFTWNKVSTTVHNLVLGTLWLDHHGEIVIKNHVTEDQCIVQFHPYRCFSPDAYRKVTGCVKDKDNVTRWVLQGTWDNKIEASPYDDKEEESKSFRCIWKRILPILEDDRYYNMTLLACQLNEMEDGISLSDSRRRPDQRLMEEGKWEEANELKVQLEEKQRHKRKLQEAKDKGNQQQSSYSPVWFKSEIDETTGSPLHVYTGEYWNCKRVSDWSKCPHIFL